MRTIRRFLILITVALVLLAGVAHAVDGDADNDGVPDSSDNCSGVYNPGQADWNANGKGDACEDTDRDGLTDEYELTHTYGPAASPRTTDKEDWDSDNDGWPDGYEVNTANTDPTLADTDGDGWEDPTEKSVGTDPRNPDTDGDGRKDSIDNCPKVANADQSDRDHDRKGDVCDPTPDGNPPPEKDDPVQDAIDTASGTAGGAVQEVVDQIPAPDVRSGADLVQMGTDGYALRITQTASNRFEIRAFNATTFAQVDFDTPPMIGYSANGPVSAFIYEVGQKERPTGGSRLPIIWKYSKFTKAITVRTQIRPTVLRDVNIVFQAPVKGFPKTCTFSGVPGTECLGLAVAFYNPNKATAALDPLDAVPYATTVS
jgi:hypothetical protein